MFALETSVRTVPAPLSGEDLLRPMIRRVFPGRIALVSSFGTEAAVLLHMVSRIDPETPVLFIDTGKLFAETHGYRQRLAAQFGLADVRTLHPAPRRLEIDDPAGTLWSRDPDACCDTRKRQPLERALSGFEAWITGRKRYQDATRADLDAVERSGDHVKINPLIDWSADQVSAYMVLHDLPAHPLQAQGYPSVGCTHCTSTVQDSEDARAGRWRGQATTECGIHFDLGAGSVAGSC